MSNTRGEKISRILLLERALYQVGHLTPQVYALRKEIELWWQKQTKEVIHSGNTSSPWAEELARLEKEVGPFERVQPIVAGYDADDPAMCHPERRNPHV